MSSRLTEAPPPSSRIVIPQSGSQTSPSRRRSGGDRFMESSRSTSISPIDLQSHLYASLLEARTADVALRVSGTWKAVYRLHRVVLIQAGFFRSLFTSGFVESTPKTGRRFLGQDEIDIVFDDRNITRAAFEICIARLYGGGPPLHVSPSLMPTPSKPLTPSFPSHGPITDLPPGHHPATPRFLLSLLATAVYLSIPSTASQALNAILSSVGPHTVIRYLNFAIGKPIGTPHEDEPVAAVGLENLAEEIQEDATYIASVPVRSIKRDHEAEAEQMSQKLDDLDIKKEDPSESLSDCSYECRTREPIFHYGAVSDKIGEATACWLARWGPDILSYEEKSSGDAPMPASISGIGSILPPSRVKEDSSNNVAIPVVWARGGLNPQWIRALVSSDALFVKGERERYEFAKSVVDLRRQSGIDDEEEEEWTGMFSNGVYYPHMSLDDIITLSRDVSPITGRPYVPLSVLQAAHWTQSLLRHQITLRQSSSSPVSPPASPPPSREKDLGLAVTTADILGSFSSSSLPSTNSHDDAENKPYYYVPLDTSLRLGDSGGIEGTSMDQLFELSTHITDPKASSRLVTSESNFFGIVAERQMASACVAVDPTGKSQWSPYPPFRFAVEFWDVDSLKEKQRLHSRTVWYAGSLFNVYVQVVRKKGVQLGVYLHRQSSVDPIPPSSAPSLPAISAESTYSRGPSFPPSIVSSASAPSMRLSPFIHPPTRSSTPLPSPITASTSASQSATYAPPGANAIPATAPPLTPPQPYRDPRSTISAYFVISCASATGAALTRFTSAPDVFSVSQSWGWKSSSLRTEEYLEVGPLTEEHATPGGREVSLRATVVLGIV